MVLGLAKRLKKVKEEERRVVNLIRECVLEASNNQGFNGRRFIVPRDLRPTSLISLCTKVEVVKLDSLVDILKENPSYETTIDYTIEVYNGNVIYISAPSEPKPLNGTSSSDTDFIIMKLVGRALLELCYERINLERIYLYRKELT